MGDPIPVAEPIPEYVNHKNIQEYLKDAYIIWVFPELWEFLKEKVVVDDKGKHLSIDLYYPVKIKALFDTINEVIHHYSKSGQEDYNSLITQNIDIIKFIYDSRKQRTLSMKPEHVRDEVLFAPINKKDWEDTELLLKKTPYLHTRYKSAFDKFKDKPDRGWLGSAEILADTVSNWMQLGLVGGKSKRRVKYSKKRSKRRSTKKKNKYKKTLKSKKFIRRKKTRKYNRKNRG
tara:strand:- start:76 stop:771 length:696 start_codon:yes stop_codon:yes gene_type:complete